ncbi:GNAT family N-acetyltransferase [Serratia sp. AKBS12]|uniref:GNAT family N-acetyltransferase n=1 Tax=Serratia sp. AKBS12 TaxID=2974597 RepID=UPI0021651A60|nr:GNAT family N-acetyltransferase [Serratia sp. AKBS12]MCS3409483.1 GNAT family N-acetyltransferase [Serratia sp. AKBS12]HEI8865797.1 GNAT family N-acetyltransferase [Serratia odorifera]
MIDIRQLDVAAAQAAIPDLAQVLHASVWQGASIGFITPFSVEQAAAFWHSLLPAIASGERLMLAALDGQRIVGTVQLLLAMPANGAHRAEIVKLMVHPQARRQGIARSLMQHAERLAVAHQRRLLVLDTVSDSPAESLYRLLGFQLAGRIPQYARASLGDTLDATSYMFKLL